MILINIIIQNFPFILFSTSEFLTVSLLQYILPPIHPKHLGLHLDRRSWRTIARLWRLTTTFALKLEKQGWAVKTKQTISWPFAKNGLMYDVCKSSTITSIKTKTNLSNDAGVQILKQTTEELGMSVSNLACFITHRIHVWYIYIYTPYIYLHLVGTVNQKQSHLSVMGNESNLRIIPVASTCKSVLGQTRLPSSLERQKDLGSACQTSPI